MHQPIIGFDLDEVLGNFRDPMYAALQKRYPDYSHWRDWSTFNHCESQGVSAEDFLRIIVEDKILEVMRPEPFAHLVVSELRAIGFEIAVITARGYYPEGKRVTREWLADNEIVVDWLRVVPFGVPKAKVIRELGPVVAYIDDHAQHLESLRQDNFAGELVLMNRPWNADVPGFWRARDLTGYLQIITRSIRAAA